MNISHCCKVLALCALFCFAGAFYDHEPMNDQMLRHKILQAKTSGDAGQFYQKLFHGAARERLLTFSKDPDVGISLHAYWEMHNATIPRGHRTFGTSARVLDPKHAQRFLGFLEGRAHLSVPEWWEKAFPDPSQAKQPEFHKSSLGIYIPRNTSLKKDGNKVHVRVGGNAVTMHARIFEKLLKEYPGRGRQCTIDLGPTHSFVAVFDSVAASFPLLCIDSRSGKLLWKSDVWAVGHDNLAVIGGSVYHRRELRVSEKHVTVWGYSVFESYVEAFDLEKGTNLFRFSTNYWSTKEQSGVGKAE